MKLVELNTHAVVVAVQSGRQKTCLYLEGPTVVVRFVAVEVNAAKPGAVDDVESDGSELLPFAGPPFGSLLITVVVGLQSVADVAVCKHVLRR